MLINHETSSLGEQYTNFIKTNEQCHFPVDFAKTNLPEYMRRYHVELQHIPVLIDEAKVKEFHLASSGLVEIVKKIPKLIFNNNADDITKFYQYKRPEVVKHTLMSAQYGNTTLSRNDFIYTSSGLKALELNCSATLGGWNIPFFFDMYRNQLPVSQFSNKMNLNSAFSLPLCFFLNVLLIL